jgi:hypothetical protein
MGTRRRMKNVAQGFYDNYGVFHPIRASKDYDESRVGGKRRKKSKKKKKRRR